MTDTNHYIALALQTGCPAINALDDESARISMRRQIERVGTQVRGAKAFIGADLRLVVLPEYFMTGYPMGETIAAWRSKGCIAPEGEEYAALARIAADNDLYLSGNVYETDAHFPELYFQTSFVVAPKGDTILRYRRLISMFAPTPHDVWDRYLEIYGADAVFPVADTPIGRLACCASEEILYPEICRAHALRGAEVILHSTSEVSSPDLTPKDVAKRARAIENLVFVVSANSGGITNSPIPASSVDGMSKVVDFRGQVLSTAGVGESMVANAEIDLGALRRYRRRPGMPNVLARQRLELFADDYTARSVYPANSLLDESGRPFVPDRSHFLDTQRRVIDNLAKKGLI